jgi:CRISPR-associated protein Cmr2
MNEPSVKDSLSGQREALHRDKETAKQFWKYVATLSDMNSCLRPEGRERLDAIGLVKRFAELRKNDIPSVSTVAAWDFYQRAKNTASIELAIYRQAVEHFNRAKQNMIYKARPQNEDWQFDGDLFFEETLTPGRMEDSYGDVQASELGAMRKGLKGLYEKLGERPSPYYAIIVLDGDGMGKHLEELLEKENPEQQHRDFSAALAEFSKFAQREVTEANGGFMVYNGGDDVVCLASREKALGLAKRLADEFHQLTRCTASAGLVIAHHLTPLSLALEEARRAEKAAKALKDKNAVCVTLLKRSGSPLVARSQWSDLSVYEEARKAIQDEKISARLPYALERDALTLAALDEGGQVAGLKYLLGRHGKDVPLNLASDLHTWAEHLNQALAVDKAQPPDEMKFTPGLPEVAHWLVLARFMANGGE